MDTTKEIKEIRAKIKASKQTELQRLKEDSRRLLSLAPEQAAAELDRRCVYCGNLLIPTGQTEREFAGQVRVYWNWPESCGCQAEYRATERQAILEAEAQVDAQRELYLSRLKLAGLRGRLQDATFDTFGLRQDWPGADAIKARVWEYTEKLLGGEFERKQAPAPIPAADSTEAETAKAMLAWMGQNQPVKNWLILYGHYGTGKSHLAAAIIREAVDRGLTGCYFRGWVHYLQRLQWSWNRDETDREAEKEADIVRELQEGAIVVIDDLDKRTPSEWVRSSLYSVLHYRYEAGLPTILTFNYGPDDADPKARGRLALEAYLGRAVLDRLIESAYDVIEFTGPSYRSGVTLEVG